jgi:dipeptidyl aminopeptidase/acylaminoacyl peptidase
VSDRALFFTASDGANSAQMRPVLERLMGSPLVDLNEMQETSPLYRVRDLTLPVMLVHGREDTRVDFEHSRRLVRMLNLENRPPVVLAPTSMGHRLDQPFQAIIVWSAVANFLQQNLGEKSAESPETAEKTFTLK